MINKSYKIWIILFIIVNLLLLVWSLGYFKFLEKFAIQDDIIVIEPDNQFKKYPAPKDQSFPNEKSKVWQAFEDKQNQGEILKNNQDEENNFENKSNKIENNKETENVQVNKENKLIDDGQVEVKPSESNPMLVEKNNSEEIKLNSNLKTNNDQITNKSEKNFNLEEDNTNKVSVFYVQIASLSKKNLVEKEWNRIKKKNPKYMSNLTYISQKAQLKDNRVFFRLLVGKFRSKNEANIFCDNLSISKCIIKKNNE